MLRLTLIHVSERGHKMPGANSQEGLPSDMPIDLKFIPELIFFISSLCTRKFLQHQGLSVF